MLYNVVQCCTMLCNVVQWCTMVYNGVHLLCNVVQLLYNYWQKATIDETSSRSRDTRLLQNIYSFLSNSTIHAGIHDSTSQELHTNSNLIIREWRYYAVAEAVKGLYLWSYPYNKLGRVSF